MRKGRRDSESWRDVTSLVFLPHFHDILHLLLPSHSPRRATPEARVDEAYLCGKRTKAKRKAGNSPTFALPMTLCSTQPPLSPPPPPKKKCIKCNTVIPRRNWKKKILIQNFGGKKGALIDMSCMKMANGWSSVACYPGCTVSQNVSTTTNTF